MFKKILTVILLVLSITLFAAEQLKFVVLITRHGDRTPFANIEKSKYKWNTGYGQLTPIGMNEEFELGTKLRKRYIEDLKLLKANYVDDSIYAVSSDTNRTILSGECVLMGMYPPGTGPVLENKKPALPYKIQPIPIRTVSKDSSLIMTPYPKYIKILQKNIYPEKVWQNKDKEMRPQYKKWSEILGNKIENLGDVLSIGDVLIVAEHHNLPMPKGLSEKSAKEIIELTDWGLATQFKNEKVAYLCGGKLVNAIAGNLNDFIAEKQPYKLVYYSGHDITLLPVISLLGAPLEKASGYASHIQIELYEKNKSSKIIRVRYDGEWVKLPIMGDNNYCSLEDFLNHIKKQNKKYKAEK